VGDKARAKDHMVLFLMVDHNADIGVHNKDSMDMAKAKNLLSYSELLWNMTPYLHQ
jgi:hypothetical protein